MWDCQLYEAWAQLVKYFKSEDPEQWNLELCPVPIELERMKTDFEHFGFLEYDAVDAIRNYVVNVRIPKFGKIKQDESIFLTTKGRTVTDGWISKMINKLAIRAEIQKKIPGYELCNRYEKTPHELRDTLDSIMTKCNSAFFVIEQSLGHVPKSNYEKTAIMFQEDLRREYSKAANKLNIFTKISRVVSGTDDSDELRADLNDVRAKLKQREDKDLDNEFASQRHDKSIKQLEEKIMNELEQKEKRIAELESKLANQTGNKKPMEFCCANYSIIHDMKQCPSCGSTERRIYHPKVS